MRSQAILVDTTIHPVQGGSKNPIASAGGVCQIYQAWDSRHKRPEDRGQDPKDWFTKGYTDTGESLFLDAPHDPTEYFIYKSNEPYPEGKVELLGIDEVIGDPSYYVDDLPRTGTTSGESGWKFNHNVGRH